MNIWGIGIDLVDIDRIELSFKKNKKELCEKIFTVDEIDYCEGRKDFVLCYAARLAAKEAVVKALGCGIGAKIGWQDMEICKNESGAPFIKFSKKGNLFLNKINVSYLKINLTHTNKTAGAVAIAISK